MPGKKFPDLTGDGKVTKKDILKARGVPGFKKGGGVKKKKEKEDKRKGVDPLGLMKPKKEKPIRSGLPKPKIGQPMPMTPELIEKFKKREYQNPRAPKRDRDEIAKVTPLAKGGMARKDKDDAKALKGIEKQQESQAKRAQQAHKDVREYSRKKARKFKEGGMVRGTGSAISGKKFQGVF